MATVCSVDHPLTNDVYSCVTALCEEDKLKKIEYKLHQHIFIKSKYLKYINENFTKESENYLVETYVDTKDSSNRKQNIWMKYVEIFDKEERETDKYFSIKTVVEKGENDIYIKHKEEKYDFKTMLSKKEFFQQLYPITEFKIKRTTYSKDNVILYVDNVEGLTVKDFNYTICTIEVNHIDHLQSILTWKNEIPKTTFGRSKIVKFIAWYETKLYDELVDKKYISQYYCYYDYDGEALEDICDVDEYFKELESCRWGTTDEE
ncbi:hypothetical protein ABK040_004936 [Willaertia magna]